MILEHFKNITDYNKEFDNFDSYLIHIIKNHFFEFIDIELRKTYIKDEVGFNSSIILLRHKSPIIKETFKSYITLHNVDSASIKKLSNDSIKKTYGNEIRNRYNKLLRIYKINKLAI